MSSDQQKIKAGALTWTELAEMAEEAEIERQREAMLDEREKRGFEWQD